MHRRGFAAERQLQAATDWRSGMPHAGCRSVVRDEASGRSQRRSNQAISQGFRQEPTDQLAEFRIWTGKLPVSGISSNEASPADLISHPDQDAPHRTGGGRVAVRAFGINVPVGHTGHDCRAAPGCEA